MTVLDVFRWLKMSLWSSSWLIKLMDMFDGLTQQQGKMTESKLKISCVLLTFIFWDDKQLCQWDWVVVVLGCLETLAVQWNVLTASPGQVFFWVFVVVGYKWRKKNAKTDEMLHSYYDSNSVWILTTNQMLTALEYFIGQQQQSLKESKVPSLLSSCGGTC